MKVLLVCENPRLCMQATTALVAGDDVDVLEVVTPQRALQLLDEGRFADIVVADADTAPTGGMALAREVKARARMGKDMPPVVLLIARDQDRWLTNWSQADAFVLKPPDSFDLAAVIHALVDDEPLPRLPGVWVGSMKGVLEMPGALEEVDVEAEAGEASDNT